jgi:pimeloyl-ACP methyl ester carboxylesterase
MDRLLATPGVGYVVGAAALAGSGAALTSRQLRTRVARELELDDRYLRNTRRMLLAPQAWRSFFAEQQLLFRDVPALESRLHEIAAPTTVVIGTADRIVPVSSARTLAYQVTGARLVELERANHLLPQQRAPQLAELIVEAGSGS